MKAPALAGITTGVLLVPVLAFIEENRENLSNNIKKTKESWVCYVLPSFGVTLRDQHRFYYYEKLDEHFPGVKEEYE